MAYQFEKDGKLSPPSPEALVAADEDSYLLVLDKGDVADGTPYWAYVAIKPSKYKEYIRLTEAHQPLRLSDYGTILKYGFEPEVHGDIYEGMQREHGFDEQFLPKLIDDIKKTQNEFLKAQENQRIGNIVAMLKKKQGG